MMEGVISSDEVTEEVMRLENIKENLRSLYRIKKILDDEDEDLDILDRIKKNLRDFYRIRKELDLD